MFKTHFLLTALTVTALVISPVARAEEKAANCAAEHKFYDESHMAYDAAFAKEYGLPQENVTEMPEDLRFIEMVIRTENGKPVCRLNMALKNDPKFAFPKEDYRDVWFDSTSENLFKALSKFSSWTRGDVPLILIGGIASENLWEPSTGLSVHSLQKINDSVFLSSHVSCRDAYVLKNVVLQVQRSQPTGTPEDVIQDPYHPEVFFEKVPLPEKWVLEKVNPSLKSIFQINKTAKICRSKETKKEGSK